MWYRRAQEENSEVDNDINLEKILSLMQKFPEVDINLIKYMKSNFEGAFVTYIALLNRDIREVWLRETGSAHLIDYLYDTGLENIPLPGNYSAYDVWIAFREIIKEIINLDNTNNGAGISVLEQYLLDKNYVPLKRYFLPKDYGKKELPVDPAYEYVDELTRLLRDYFLEDPKQRFDLYRAMHPNYISDKFKNINEVSDAVLSIPIVQEFVKSKNLYGRGQSLIKFFPFIAKKLSKEFVMKEDSQVFEIVCKALEDLINKKVFSYFDVLKELRNRKSFLLFLNRDELRFIRKDVLYWIIFSKTVDEWLPKIKDYLVSKFDDSKIKSKHFEEFNLNNSSLEEKDLFEKLEKLGLHAIPAKQQGKLILLDEDGEQLGFRIDFLLPCNVREYRDGVYNLRQDIIFVGEYFGFYGEKYDKKKDRKIYWQNNLEKSLDQRCLHVDRKSDLCSILMEKNIDSKCYPDFDKNLYSVDNINEKKTYYVKSQIQFFIYQYLVSELLWEINYDYNLNTLDNLQKVKESNGVYLDRFEKLLLNVEKYSPKFLVDSCAKIVSDYSLDYLRKRKRRRSSLV